MFLLIFTKKCLTGIIGVSKVFKLLILLCLEGCNNKRYKIYALEPCDEQESAKYKVVKK